MTVNHANCYTLKLFHMLITPHVLVGLVIIKIFPYPLGAFLLVLLSHFFLDFFIPHWNPHIYTEMKKNKKINLSSLVIILIDGLITTLIFTYLSYQALPNFGKIIIYGLTAFFSILPDLIEVPYYFFGSKNKKLISYVNFAHKYQSDGNVFWGVITQVLVILVCIKQLFF